MLYYFQAHVYHLMKSDSYSRYLRSEMYKDFLNGSKKKVLKYFNQISIFASEILDHIFIISDICKRNKINSFILSAERNILILKPAIFNSV